MSDLHIMSWGYALIAFKELDSKRGYEIVGTTSVWNCNEEIGRWVRSLLATKIAHETSKPYCNEQAPVPKEKS